MGRKLLAYTLIVLSSILLLASVIGIGAAWYYNKPLERETLRRLTEIESELRQGQTALGTAQTELENSLSMLDSSEQALNNFTANDPEAFFGNVQSTLDDQLVPELQTARERLVTARDTIENLRVTVFGLNAIPFININIPDKMLTDLIDSADALESEIGDVSELAAQASTFLTGASELMGGDFSETRESLEGFLDAVKTYREKVTGWQGQVADIKKSLPTWIDRTSIGLTIFLLWFGLSQFGLLLHGRMILHGQNPLDVSRK